VAIGFCGLLGVLLPAAFGAINGIPKPLIHDEFSYLLGADTIAHGRLTNPSPPLPEFFEAPHVLVVPSYNSKYPPGQSVVLAVGQILGQPIWGVWLSCGIFAASLCWMLQAWTSRKWALAISVLSITTLGTSTYWAQSYWGGMAPASGAALLFGGLRRILRGPRAVATAALASGALILANTRPFEGSLVCLAVAAVIGSRVLRSRLRAPFPAAWRSVIPGAALLALGVVAMLVYNQAVAGSAWRTPYGQHLDQYFQQGVFLFSPPHVPARTPPDRIASFYRRHAFPPEHGMKLLARAGGRVPSCLMGSLGAALGVLDLPSLDGRQPFHGGLVWLVVLGSLCANLGVRRVLLTAALAGLIDVSVWWCAGSYPSPIWAFIIGAWAFAGAVTARGSAAIRFIIGTVLLSVLGQSVVWWWQPHYASPIVPLVLAAAALILRRIVRLAGGRRQVRAVGPTLAAAVSVHLLLLGALSGVTRNPGFVAERSDVVSHASVSNRLKEAGGQHLVFVRYASDFSVNIEWVYNLADLPTASVLYAHDLGPARNPELIAAFPGRLAWMVTLSGERMLLEPYRRVPAP
jgi:hypothetical protein